MIALRLALAAAAAPAPGAPASDPASPAPAPDPGPAAPVPIPLDAGDEALPTALDGLEQARAERDGSLTLDEVVADWGPSARQHLRSQGFVKPLAGVMVLPGSGGSARLGVAAGHRAWTLKPGVLSFGTEERIVAAGLLGAGAGGGVSGSALLGPWVGPVGLRVGPTARVDAVRWTAAVALPGAAAAGIAGDLTLLAGPVSLTAGVEPAWLFGASRQAARGAAILALGDETTWRAGLGWVGRPLQWGLDLEVRDTIVGPLWSGGLSIQPRFL